MTTLSRLRYHLTHIDNAIAGTFGAILGGITNFGMVNIYPIPTSLALTVRLGQIYIICSALILMSFMLDRNFHRHRPLVSGYCITLSALAFLIPLSSVR